MEIDWNKRKIEILNKLLVQKQATLSSAESSLEEMRKIAIDAPGRMESRYDSTKQEYSYLADDTADAVERGNQEIKQLQELIVNTVNPTSITNIGSIITATMDGQERIYMLLSLGGGTTVDDEVLGKINVVSATSPIGAKLLNKKVGEKVELNKKEIIIKEIH